MTLYSVQQDSAQGGFRPRPDSPIGEELQQQCFDSADVLHKDRKSSQNKEASRRFQKNRAFAYELLQDAKNSPRFGGLNLDSRDLRAEAAGFARELEHVYSEMNRDLYAPNSAFELFETDTSPPAGKKYHTVQRIKHKGDAHYFRGDSSRRGNADVATTEKRFPIHPIVTTIRFDFFDALANNFMAMDLERELDEAASQVLMNFKNDKTFSGQDDLEIRGIFNYDWNPEGMASMDLEDSTNPEGIIQEVGQLFNRAYNESRQRFYPNRIIVPPSTKQVWKRTYRSAQSDKTVYDAIMENNERLESIETAHEMADYGPDGAKSMLMDRKGDRATISNVIPAPPSILEMQRTGFQIEIPMFMLDGGIIMRKPLNTYLIHWSE